MVDLKQQVKGIPDTIGIPLNVIRAGTQLTGQVVFNEITQIEGKVVGEIVARTLILSESAVIEGTIRADTLIIHGWVQGNIVSSRLILTRTGRIMGDVETTSLILEFGAYFKGYCTMNCVQ